MADDLGWARVPAGVPAAMPVDIVADAYLVRQTTLARLASRGVAPLWPRFGPGNLDAEFARELVYTASTTEQVGTPGAIALRRWPEAVRQVPVVMLGPGDDLYSRTLDARAWRVQEAAVAMVNRATGGTLRLLPPMSGPTSVASVIRVRLAPGYDACLDGGHAAVATVSGTTIRSVTITFCTERWTHEMAIAAHELGHGIGLRHSSGSGDLMNPRYVQSSGFSEREVGVVSLMLQRPPGNLFPDNDRGATAAVSEAFEISCP